ncbi:MAG: hypothetical protein LBT05_07185 [Planctomycetaceae bacterium]|jgi:membrane-bound serine protease (ClpP class)|nr:hypothetical protein [Planctomycetaceae bacterium]
MNRIRFFFCLCLIYFCGRILFADEPSTLPPIFSPAAIRVDMRGPITFAKANQTQRTIQHWIRDGIKNQRVNFICLWIDSSGGDLAACLQFAEFLTQKVNPAQTRIVAYIPYQARSGAAVIAAACHEIVVRPETILGGDGSTAYSDAEIKSAVTALSQLPFPSSSGRKRSWSIAAAFLDKDLEVAEYALKTDPNLKAFFCEKELAEQPNSDVWIKGNVVKRSGQIWEITGPKAANDFLVSHLVRRFDEFRKLYRLENETQLTAPGLGNALIRMLLSPWISSLILMIGFIAAWKELHTPGLGIGASVSLLCFVLFFWCRFVAGTADWHEVLLIFIGVALLALEIFVIPGFGAAGVCGSFCLVAGFVLASQAFIIPQNPYQISQMTNSGLVFIIAGVGTIAALTASSRLLQEANRPHDTALIGESEKLADYARLAGKTGVTITPLAPSGLAAIDGETVDVASEGEMLDAGTAVQVVEIRGYRVIVRKT